MNRQKKILLSLFGLLLLSIGYAYWMMPVQQRVASSTATVGSQSASETTAAIRTSDKNRLLMELLDKDPTRYQGYQRDLFNFYVPKPVKKTPPPVRKPVERPVVKAPPPAVTPVIRQQLARFTFLGFLDKDEIRTVFLTRGDELFLVRENDTFGDDQQFTAVLISAEKMSIRQTGDSRLIEIPLIEKEPLVPTMQKPDIATPTPPDNPAAPDSRPGATPPLLKR